MSRVDLRSLAAGPITIKVFGVLLTPRYSRADPRVICHISALWLLDSAVEDRWYDPKAEYFRVRTSHGKRYILRYDQHADQWTLQSGFDGAELLVRPGIEFVGDPILIYFAADARDRLEIVGRKFSESWHTAGVNKDKRGREKRKPKQVKTPKK